MGLTSYGDQFLKSVLAPYDFAQLGCSGLPDEFDGPTFTVLQRQLFSFNSSTTQDQYFAVLPTPQVAYWHLATDPSSDIGNSTEFRGIEFSDTSVFGSTYGTLDTDTVNSMRVLGLTAEIKCTSSALMANGAISVARNEVRLSDRSISRVANVPAVGGPVQLSGNKAVEGLASLAAGVTSAANYTGRAVEGMFAVARHVGPWAFSSPIDMFAPNTATSLLIPSDGVESPPSDSDGVLLLDRNAGPNPPRVRRFDWFDNSFESIMVMVPQAAQTVSFTLEVIMVVECRPQSNSILAKIAAPSPGLDPLAMEMYKRMIHNMPIAVPAAQNARWWEYLLTLLKTGGYIASHIPGPIGGVGKGVEMVATGFEELFI
jgi:hypothetical protein